jgi:hypothetical protein
MKRVKLTYLTKDNIKMHGGSTGVPPHIKPGKRRVAGIKQRQCATKQDRQFMYNATMRCVLAKFCCSGK